MPSQKEQAKEKFQQGVEQTRRPADDTSEPQGTNPKLGGSQSQPIATGDTEASRYTGKRGATNMGPSATDQTKEPGGL